MSAKHLIERKQPVTESLLDPDRYADEDWAVGVHEMDSTRSKLVELGFNKSALGTTPGGLTHFIYWCTAKNGNKLQFEEPSHADQWLVSIVCPPPRDWRKEKQKVAGGYASTGAVALLATALNSDFRLDNIDPKTILNTNIARYKK